MNNQNKDFGSVKNFVFTFLFAWLLIGAVLELFQVAWGTGRALGQFSLPWFLIFTAFSLFAAAGLAVGIRLVFFARPSKLHDWLHAAARMRNQAGWLRPVLLAAVVLFPLWLLQYSMYGIVFDGFYLRSVLLAFTLLVAAFLLTGADQLISWKGMIAALVIVSGLVSSAVSFLGVTNYPFSLGWSEGNRLWDYSILFGRSRYLVAGGGDIYVFLDLGRQFLGGIPYLYPDVTIAQVRAWVGLTQVLPYVLIGLAAFQPFLEKQDWRAWLLFTLWFLVFLKQGPIHPPLIVIAALTIFAWRKPLWLAAPVLILAGYSAHLSRYTWVFAPGLWIGMLALAGLPAAEKPARSHLIHAGILVFSGLFGGLLLPKILSFIEGLQSHAPSIAAAAGGAAGSGLSFSKIMNSLSKQPLLWYRLLPNPTFGMGIIAALLIAILPTAYVLWRMQHENQWRLARWQAVVLILPLAAFLAVGLVASTKIGGGGDLHNLDMFFIGVAFTVCLAWLNGGRDYLLSETLSAGVKGAVIIALMLPAFSSYMQLRPADFSGNINDLMALTDSTQAKELGVLPDEARVAAVLDRINRVVADNRQKGEVLFMDQRQLLTFGYVRDVPLVSDYDKKLLIEKAMADDSAYFETFYNDLADKRFSLIVTQPLFTVIKGSEFSFGEENDAWTKWVSIPLLCFYQEKDTFKDIGVQLLVPKPGQVDCSAVIPQK